MSKPLYQLRFASPADIPKLFDLEISSFPEDEAASEETMAMRCQLANPYFAVANGIGDTQDILSFINGTCSSHRSIHHDSMSTHDPLGEYLVIHSVTVRSDQRRRGLGLAFLRDYVSYLSWHRLELKGVNLLSKAYLLPFYQRAGFVVKGISPVQHGQEQWFELCLDLEVKRREMLFVDTFSDRKYSGNVAAVVFSAFEDEKMKKIAVEMNLPVTVFLSAQPFVHSNESQQWPSLSDFNIRWFSANAELKLCGHGTVAATYALTASGRLPVGTLVNYKSTQSAVAISASTIVPSGILTPEKDTPLVVELEFPALPPVLTALAPTDLDAILGCFKVQESEILATGVNGDGVVVELAVNVFLNLNERTVGGFNLDLLKTTQFRKIILTCAAPLYDAGPEETASASSSRQFRDASFLSRCFLSRGVVNEDLVTGSAHCLLGPYWATKFGHPLPATLVGYQDSSRGGYVTVTVTEGRATISGTCVTTLRGALVV